jgi:SAM-dependent methyltransferase
MGHWRPTLRRALGLLADFRHEQDDPRRFYTALARDSIGQVSRYVDVKGKIMLDVGGGPGYFREAFETAGATYYALDTDVGELAGSGEVPSGTLLGSGLALPFRDGCFDISYSSNVLEHVAEPWLMAEEMLRATRSGGIIFISYTVWWGPWGGHETAPWHFLGGHLARRRYHRRHGREPKNRYGESLFAVTVGQGLSWSRAQSSAQVIAVVPRYNPSWSYWMLKIPLVREVVTWNLVLVLRKN